MIYGTLAVADSLSSAGNPQPVNVVDSDTAATLTFKSGIFIYQVEDLDGAMNFKVLRQYFGRPFVVEEGLCEIARP